MNPRISMVTPGVKDLATSVQFSQQGLGLPCMDSPPEASFFTLNGSRFALYSRESLAENGRCVAGRQRFGGHKSGPTESDQ